MKRILLPLTLLLAGFCFACKDTNSGFSPGAGDSRITGTWRLYERRFSKDSTLYSISITKDSVLRDSVYVTKIDTIRISRDTSFYTTRRYAGLPQQTLTFGADGRLERSGEEVTYYAPYKFYRVDKTYPDSLFVDLFIYTNGANIPVRQGLEFKQDTLILKPFCERPCYSKLLRVR
ncbi:hypothetical protein [Spirosoma sp.]|uniref:hypothetical protein n=1 Tax=Spirosoma sp. TaxID=1899569 RepID=UPI003B3ABB0B